MQEGQEAFLGSDLFCASDKATGQENAINHFWQMKQAVTQARNCPQMWQAGANAKHHKLYGGPHDIVSCIS